MKTFLLDTINRIKRFSESLDVKTALCDRPWVVFNDSGDKEVLIFDTDGNGLFYAEIPANEEWDSNGHGDGSQLINH